MKSENAWTKEALHVLYSTAPRGKRLVRPESAARLVMKHAGVGVTPEQCRDKAMANGWADESWACRPAMGGE